MYIRDPWPNPEHSIGKFRATIDGNNCWNSKGPAAILYRTLAPQIQDVLNDYMETWQQQDVSQHPLGFTMWMMGRTETTAKPALIFASHCERTREEAKQVVMESGLLANYPEVIVTTTTDLSMLSSFIAPILFLGQHY
jgi:hypothetical protein